jgi:hypothetical protein
MYKCEILIIDEVEDNEWKFWEKHYISLFKSWGFKLKNKNNGGGGLTTVVFSEERNRKISEKTKGIPRPYTQKIPKGFIIGHNINKGRKHSKETLIKMSLKKLGYKQNELTKTKKNKKLKGQKRSDETKLKQSLASKGKSKSEQHIKNMMLNRENVIKGVILAKSKPVLQYDLEGNFIKEWDSITKAKNIFKGNIYSCVNNRQKTACGYIWKFK